MLNARRKRLAWLFALVLLLELAVFCCALGHISSHVCPEGGRCVICAFINAELRRASFTPLLILLVAARSLPAFTERTHRAVFESSLFAFRVRLND